LKKAKKDLETLNRGVISEIKVKNMFSPYESVMMGATHIIISGKTPSKPKDKKIDSKIKKLTFTINVLTVMTNLVNDLENFKEKKYKMLAKYLKK
jgi:maleate cis-trans isomerase